MSDFRKRILEPALIPLGAFAFIGALAYALSRILLAVTTEGSVVVGVLMAACIRLAAAAVAKGGVLKKMQKISLIAFSLLLLGGGIAVEAALGPREVEAHLEVADTITARNIAFDKKELVLPATQAAIVRFVNQDSAPNLHNIAIYRSQTDTATPLFKGTIFGGPKTQDYEVPAIPTGVYYFQCDVHAQIPAMQGTVQVGGATGGASPGPTPGSTQPASPPPATGTAAAPIDLTARGIAFDKKELSFPATTQVTINFRNEDAATQHNWALYKDSTAAQAFFNGPLVTGPAEEKYVLTSPGPGTYFYRCDVHPAQMNGTATVT